MISPYQRPLSDVTNVLVHQASTEDTIWSCWQDKPFLLLSVPGRGSGPLKLLSIDSVFSTNFHTSLRISSRSAHTAPPLRRGKLRTDPLPDFFFARVPLNSGRRCSLPRYIIIGFAMVPIHTPHLPPSTISSTGVQHFSPAMAARVAA